MPCLLQPDGKVVTRSRAFFRGYVQSSHITVAKGVLVDAVNDKVLIAEDRRCNIMYAYAK